MFRPGGSIAARQNHGVLMTPQDLAKRHPKLFHMTNLITFKQVRRHGLLTAEAIVQRCVAGSSEQERLLSRRRPRHVHLTDPRRAMFILSDNRPLSEAKLSKVLEDGLTPKDWLKMLSKRVFFWTDRKSVNRLMEASNHATQRKVLLEIDTLKFAQAYGDMIEISPINSGATIHQAAARGHATFAPIRDLDFAHWRRSRPKKSPDTIREVTVPQNIPDILKFCAHET
jgi:hypothetical protein